MAVIDPSTTQDNKSEYQSQDDAWAKRAREDDMDVALAHRGDCYEVDSASGNTYDVDLVCPVHIQHATPIISGNYQQNQEHQYSVGHR